MKPIPYFSKLFSDIERLPLRFKEEDIEDVFMLMACQRPGGQHHFHAYVPKGLDKKLFHDAAKAYLGIAEKRIAEPDFTSCEFVSRLALGDALTMTCGIRDFKAAFPEVKVRVVSTAPRIWDNIPYIDQSLDKPEKVFSVGTGWLTNASNRLDTHMANAYRISIQNETGLAFEQGPIRPDIWLSEEEYNAEPIIPGPYWVIILGGELGWPLKMYPLEKWQQVVDSLPDITFVQLGAEEHTNAHGRLSNNKGNVIDFVGKTQDPQTGIRDLFRIFLHAQGSVGLVSMHMHLSAAFQNPCVVVAGAREPAWFTQYMGHQYLHVNGCLPCATERACWHCGLDACKNLLKDGKTPKCADIIAPEDITRAILKYYEGGRLEMGRKVANTLFKNIARGKPTEKVQVAFSGVSISREGWDALERFCAERKPERILEYGPGVSTGLFKKHAAVVHSIESEPQTYNVGLDTLVSKPEGRYDFVFVDGPRGAWSGDKDDIKNYSRYLPVQTARDHTDCIVLHNALRDAERRVCRALLAGWKEHDLRVDRGMVAYFRPDEHVRPDEHGGAGDRDTEEARRSEGVVGKPGKGLVKILTSCRGYGGSEKSTIMLMRMFLERGYRVDLIPWGGEEKVCAPYRAAIPEGVNISKDLRSECDALLYYTTDTVYFPEMKDAAFDDLMGGIRAERKAMCVNYRIGHLKEKEWAKGWDLYLFLCSQKDAEWRDKVGAEHTAVLPPPTDLTDFFAVKRRYHTYRHVRLIRHNAQGDAKWRKDINEFLKAAWDIDPKTEWHCMPAASWMTDDPRIFKFRKNELPVHEFLSRGNCFIYNLPDGYQDQGPRVIMEAMATGLPVIADNRWGAKDRVTEESGWLCDNLQDYLKALQDIAELPSLLSTKGKTARKIAKDTFDPYAWVDKVLG